ncbi:filamentous hemagglutinin N-terminal domain-containing protein [Halomicronema sp. CCY15110]|uniref:two-partner secretion domain-containing protein n=1 Tax=Halomicronema sp. CCY15110 TaxID=2767773 RepID=UPI0019526D42|nr:filamentous hemagglutinin N-terminal domain-containing protein [Halomicronema sp. CCY15110]
MLAWFPGQTALAQLIPDDTLGAESSQVILDAGGFPLDLIQGGAIRDQNLFHSFAEFNIDEGRSTYFIVPAEAIANIISRVTGDNPSNLLGVLGTVTANGDPTPANLYFINPNGIVFGENAELDISGSFFASTAEAIQLGDGIYSATTPETSSLLTVNPSAMFGNYLTAASGDITSRGELAVGGSLTLAANRLDLGGSLLAPEALTLLARGDVAIADSIILTLESGPQDAIEENILIQGNTISVLDSVLVASFQAGLNNADATANVLPIGGNVELRGNRISVIDSILFTAGNRGQRGDVHLTATETVDLVATQDQNFGLTSLIDGTGQAGDIVITAANLNVVDTNSETNFNHFNLLTTAFEGGNSGNIILDVKDTVLLEGNSISTVASVGTSGDIRIATTNLRLQNGATLQASTVDGNAGDITVTVSDTISMNGFGRSPVIAPILNAQPSAIFATATGDRGQAGNIQVTANRLVLEDLAGIVANADGLGQAGEIQIIATELQLLNGGNIASNASGSSAAGDINLAISGTATFAGGAVSSLNPSGVLNASGVFSRTFDESSGGSINLNANQLNLRDGATISTANFGSGEGGDIVLNVAETVVLEGISPLNQRSTSTVDSSTLALGDSGTIRMQATGLTLRDGAIIASGTAGQGNAGPQIFDVERLEISSGGLFANTFEGSTGNGGGIIANTQTLILEDGAVITSQSQGTGVAGPIILNASDLLLLINSDISTVATQASGGDIAVNTAEAAERGLVVLLGDSDITTESFGDGGNITLLGTAVIAFDDSDIIARSQSGRGGNITLTNFFSETIPPDNQPPFDGDGQVDVNADGQIAAGTISSPDTSFVENSLNELSGDLVDTAALTAGSCIARSEGTEGSFVVTGGEGLPQRPGGNPIAVYPTGTVQTLPEPTPAVTLQEPQSVYRLADGRLVLSHDCQQP